MVKQVNSLSWRVWVILVGLDQKAKHHPEWLYVGATRARASLFVLALA